MEPKKTEPRKSRRPSVRKKAVRGRETEAVIQASVISALTRMGIVSNRVNSGSFQAGGKRRVACNSMDGKSDVEAWFEIKGENGFSFGVAIYIELKTAKGKQLPTQVEFERLLTLTAQKYMLVRSVADFINQLCDFRDDIKENVPGFRLVTGKVKDLQRMKNVI